MVSKREEKVGTEDGLMWRKRLILLVFLGVLGSTASTADAALQYTKQLVSVDYTLNSCEDSVDGGSYCFPNFIVSPDVYEASIGDIVYTPVSEATASIDYAEGQVVLGASFYDAGQYASSSDIEFTSVGVQFVTDSQVTIRLTGSLWSGPMGGGPQARSSARIGMCPDAYCYSGSSSIFYQSHLRLDDATSDVDVTVTLGPGIYRVSGVAGYNASASLTLSEIPEPSTALLVCVGLAGLCRRGARLKRSS